MGLAPYGERSEPPPSFSHGGPMRLVCPSDTNRVVLLTILVVTILRTVLDVVQVLFTS